MQKSKSQKSKVKLINSRIYSAFTSKTQIYPSPLPEVQKVSVWLKPIWCRNSGIGMNPTNPNIFSPSLVGMNPMLGFQEWIRCWDFRNESDAGILEMNPVSEFRYWDFRNESDAGIPASEWIQYKNSRPFSVGTKKHKSTQTLNTARPFSKTRKTQNGNPNSPEKVKSTHTPQSWF